MEKGENNEVMEDRIWLDCTNIPCFESMPCCTQTIPDVLTELAPVARVRGGTVTAEASSDRHAAPEILTRVPGARVRHR